MSSEKIRVLVFSLFLIALMVFGLAYRPTDAVSQPTSQGRMHATQATAPR
jgi:hypothetical protein